MLTKWFMVRRTFTGGQTRLESRVFIVRSASALLRRQFWLFLALSAWWCPKIAPAQVLLANFDDLTMGFVGKSFTDGGITFSNLDTAGGPSHTFAVQVGSDGATFSSPNYLVFGVYSPQPGLLLARFGSMDISFAGEATTASLDVAASTVSYTWENLLTLEGLKSGAVVASETVLVSQAEPFDGPLSVSGDFDSLRLVASGQYDRGAVVLGVDNVSVTIIPEPHSNGLVAAGMSLLALAYTARRSYSPATVVELGG
jgi:hypothetical protein